MHRRIGGRAVGDGVDPATNLPFTAGIVGITMTSQPSACTAPTFTVNETVPGIGAGASVAAVDVAEQRRQDGAGNPATAGRALPNCSTSQALPMAGGGQVTALLDATGQPLNGTGLPRQLLAALLVGRRATRPDRSARTAGN